MKKLKSIVSITTAVTLVISTPMLSLSDKDNKNNSRVEKSVTQKNDKQEKEEQKEIDKKEKEKQKESDKEVKELQKEKNETWKQEKVFLENQKDKFEDEKDVLEDQKDEFEDQLDDAEDNNDEELIVQLKTKIDEIEKQISDIELQIKNTKNSMKEVVKSRYSEKELEKIEKVGNELKKLDKDIKIIQIENINAKNKDIKFDTPPVIKHGRTLIPVRALVQGFGAKVDWDPVEKKVTITKDDGVIVLNLDDKTALVNGKEVELEVPSTSYNNRTYVPLRFIIENLGLKVEYDKETGLIEIEDIND